MLNSLDKTSSFKYLKILKNIIHVGQLNIISRNNRIFCIRFWHSKISSKTQGAISTGFFIWQKNYGEHSKNIGKVIYEAWKKGSTLYASCEYIDGKFDYRQSKDPQIENFGLANTHLRNGYPKRWELYRQVWAESISICNEIKRIIECYEKIVFDKVDESILTNKGIVKLDRKEKGFDLFPTKFNFESFYVYPKLLSEIFQEVKNREEGKKKQILWIKDAGDYEHLVIGSTDENNEREETLAYGDMKIMEELKKRVDILLDESELKRLICQYYEQKSRLQTRENLDQFDEEIKTMWDKINYNGFFVRGEGCCTNVHTCKSKPKGDFGEIDYA